MNVRFRPGTPAHQYTYVVSKLILPPDIRAWFVEQGREGGKKGGKARAAKLTPEQRSEVARNAVQARWKKWSETGYSKLTAQQRSDIARNAVRVRWQKAKNAQHRGTAEQKAVGPITSEE